MTRDLQQRTLSHPKHPLLPPSEAGSPTKRTVCTAVDKNYTLSIIMLQNFMNRSTKFRSTNLYKQATEFNEIIASVDTTVNHLNSPWKLTEYEPPL